MPAAPVGVVVVNHNSGEYLERCLSSVRAAAGEHPTEIVVVDNASTDGSIDGIEERHAGTRLIANGDNRGFAVAANQGIRATSTPYVLLLNPDAEIVGGTLEGIVKVAEERPRAGVVGVLVRNSDGSLQPSARRVPGLGEALGHAFVGPFRPNNRWSRAYTMADWDRTSEREVEWVSGSAMVIRREAFDEIGGFDEGFFMYVEDVDLCTRLRQRGWRVLFSPELEVVHEQGVSSRARVRWLAFEHSRSIYRYFVKHRSPGAAALLRPFVRLALWGRALIASRGASR
ncbi:MAG TPA: glycosyltransferase family 2 protein [Actinomycetota bacterium]|nr:glycosyltransferase family 2 protein [Actinomycetota bacterium]